jgi:hypothetical protein
MNNPARHLLRPLASAAVFLSLAACVHQQLEVGSTVGGDVGVQSATNAPLSEGIRRTVDASLRSGEAWPGFDLRSQVLIATMLPDGPVYLVGDSAPPSEFRWLDRQNLIAVREGTPPDSLALGLQLAIDWNGRRSIATAMAFTEDLRRFVPHFLVHEAFHTHQHLVAAQTRGHFEKRANPAFPDTSVHALALLNLEGAYLARALTARDDAEARQWARTALGVRGHRCNIFGEEDCATERAIEQNEGTASYVTAALLGEALGYGPAGVWQDSLAGALSPLVDVARLERWHFYDTGHAWLLLLARWGPTGWEARVESVPPDRVLAQVLGVQLTDSLTESALQSPYWHVAIPNASQVVARSLAHRDSAERVFWTQPGVPIRVYYGRPTRMSTAHRELPDGR